MSIVTTLQRYNYVSNSNTYESILHYSLGVLVGLVSDCVFSAERTDAVKQQEHLR